MTLGNSVRKLGATRAGVWVIKHIVSPLDRFVYRLSGGRRTISRGAGSEVALLTTTGRKSGQPRITPVFHLCDGERVILCNVNPGFEKTNPWVLNLRANPIATVQAGGESRRFLARAASDVEVARYWPQLIALWPAYQVHFERSGERSIFILEPLTGSEGGWR